MYIMVQIPKVHEFSKPTETIIKIPKKETTNNNNGILNILITGIDIRLMY